MAAANGNVRDSAHEVRVDSDPDSHKCAPSIEAENTGPGRLLEPARLPQLGTPRQHGLLATAAASNGPPEQNCLELPSLCSVSKELKHA